MTRLLTAYCVSRLQMADHPGHAAAMAAYVPPAAGAPFFKQKPPAGRRAASSEAGFNPENISKWRTLNKLYAPDDPDWDAAFAAESWNHPNIAPWCRRALDEGWTVDQATNARHEAEQEKEAERVRAAAKRTEQRRKALEPVHKFMQEHDMLTVHEASVPKVPDALAAANPLSQEYVNRKRRPREPKEPEASPPPPNPDEAKEAEALGIKIVPLHKDKRQAVLAGVAAPAAQAAEEALAALPPEVAAAVAKKFTKSKKKRPATPEPEEEEEEEDEEEKAKRKEREKVAKQAAILDYYKKKLAIINKLRADKGKGPLNEASRQVLLRDYAPYHYKDAPAREGFGGSVLVSAWDRPFSEDFGRHPEEKEPAAAAAAAVDAAAE